jgi:3D-(3,5/4)-trihydroxycyclohexane-1,2-dione acylhydrolase (decyclizing)
MAQMKTRFTTAQAIIGFLKNQFTERDSKQNRLFEGCLGIFGHGNIAGIGQALEQDPGLPYYLFRNEQAMVHTATAFAKMANRLRTLACTTSIGPGATNMITGAAVATINRLPVLLLPGDIFARRNVAPVLQQLESPASQNISVNDCFKPVARYWDRIERPEQILTALPAAMRVLTSPAETGAVVLALPQDVQAEAFDYPPSFFEQRVWRVPRPRCDSQLLQKAVEWIRSAKQPLIIAGGGTIYSEATEALSTLAAQTGIPVGETQAGKGSLPFNHAQALGAIGVTGTPGANILARESDLIIGVGTRYTDFTTASQTAFQNPRVRFININVGEFDAGKQSALPLVGDAQVTLKELACALQGTTVSTSYATRVAEFRNAWEREVDRLHNLNRVHPISQAEVIGVVNEISGPRDVLVCAAGSLPGDLHKMWRTRDPKGYHLEYGYSCMGYEISGGLGVKMAAPDREVYVMVGDGSYLMMAQEIVTSLQEKYKLTIVVLDNHGFSSIGSLSRACGNRGMGTEYRYRSNGKLEGDLIPVDYVTNARSLGAEAVRTATREEFKQALLAASKSQKTSVVVIETAYDQHVPGYESWWDVPIAEVSEVESVRAARSRYEEAVRKERLF